MNLLFLLPLLKFDPVNYSVLNFGKPFFLYKFFLLIVKIGGERLKGSYKLSFSSIILSLMKTSEHDVWHKAMFAGGNTQKHYYSKLI